MNEIYVKIAMVKEKLRATDYLAIKYAEGLISEEDYKPIKEQRQVWRAEINKLQDQIK